MDINTCIMISDWSQDGWFWRNSEQAQPCGQLYKERRWILWSKWPICRERYSRPWYHTRNSWHWGNAWCFPCFPCHFISTGLYRFIVLRVHTSPSKVVKLTWWTWDDNVPCSVPCSVLFHVPCSTDLCAEDWSLRRGICRNMQVYDWYAGMQWYFLAMVCIHSMKYVLCSEIDSWHSLNSSHVFDVIKFGVFDFSKLVLRQAFVRLQVWMEELSGQRSQGSQDNSFYDILFLCLAETSCKELWESSQIQVVKCCQAKHAHQWNSRASPANVGGRNKESLAMSSDEGRQMRHATLPQHAHSMPVWLKVRCPQRPNWTSAARWLLWTLLNFRVFQCSSQRWHKFGFQQRYYFIVRTQHYHFGFWWLLISVPARLRTSFFPPRHCVGFLFYCSDGSHV